MGLGGGLGEFVGHDHGVGDFQRGRDSERGQREFEA